MKYALSFLLILSLVTVATAIAPESNFIADNTTICSGDVVQFADISTNAPTSWDWDIGGDFYDVPNPTRVFATGLYSIELVACNGDGCDTELKVDFINATDCPLPTTTCEDCDEEDVSYWLVFGVSGGLVGAVLIARRTDKKDGEE